MFIHHRCVTASLLAAMFILFPSPGIRAEAAEIENEVDLGYHIEIASDISINTETNTATIPVTGTVSAWHDLEIHVTSERSYQLVNEEGSGDDLAYEISEETILFSNKDSDTAMAIDCDITVRVSETPVVCGTYSDTMTFTMSSTDYTPDMVEITEDQDLAEDPDPVETQEPTEDLVAEEPAEGDVQGETESSDPAAADAQGEAEPGDPEDSAQADPATQAPDESEETASAEEPADTTDDAATIIEDDTAAPAAEQEDSTPLPETAPADLITNSIEES